MAKHGKTWFTIYKSWQNMAKLWVWTTHHVKHVEDQKKVMECFVNRLQMFYLFFIFVECFMNTILFVNLSNLCGENDKWQNISNETKKCNQDLKDKRCVCLKIKVHMPSHLRICFKLQKLYFYPKSKSFKSQIITCMNFDASFTWNLLQVQSWLLTIKTPSVKKEKLSNQESASEPSWKENASD